MPVYIGRSAIPYLLKYIGEWLKTRIKNYGRHYFLKKASSFAVRLPGKTDFFFL
jgi:hypothetical protein